MLPKLLVIVGATSSGKSDVAVALAREYGGEVISADSRQIYHGLDIGSGKITPEERHGVPHHGLDIADPNERFSVAEYKLYADRVIGEVHKRGHLPLLVGGTGYYIQAVVEGRVPPEVTPNQIEQERRATQSTDELYTELLARDPRRARDIEKRNPRRLIRALEIVDALGAVPPLSASPTKRFTTLILGLDLPDEKLKRRITARAHARLESGFIEEVESLRAGGVSDARLRELGLDYALVNECVTGRFPRANLLTKLTTLNWHYARRQRTWFRKDTSTRWFDSRDREGIRACVAKFLNL